MIRYQNNEMRVNKKTTKELNNYEIISGKYVQAIKDTTSTLWRNVIDKLLLLLLINYYYDKVFEVPVFCKHRFFFRYLN